MTEGGQTSQSMPLGRKWSTVNPWRLLSSFLSYANWRVFDTPSMCCVIRVVSKRSSNPQIPKSCFDFKIERKQNHISNRNSYRRKTCLRTTSPGIARCHVTLPKELIKHRYTRSLPQSLLQLHLWCSCHLRSFGGFQSHGGHPKSSIFGVIFH